MMLAFPLKLTPEKSALEFTRANTPGPEFPDTCPPRKNASELPSIRMPALRASPPEPLPQLYSHPRNTPDCWLSLAKTLGVLSFTPLTML